VTAKLNSKYADPSGDHPDVQLFFGGYLANCAKTGTIGEPEDTENPFTNRSISISPVVLHPKSRGYITLKSSNPLDPPLMYANYLSDPADMATLLDAINITLKLGNTKILKERFGFELDKTPIPSCIQKHPFGTEGYWECYSRTATGPENHQVGSCRMGPSNDPMAVVDPELKVYGVKNLRIMDASVMPMVVSGNTNAPIMMIAEKGSDMIKKLWTSNDIRSRFGFGNANQNNNNNNVTSVYDGTTPSHSGGYNRGSYPNGGNQRRRGYGTSEGHSSSAYGGNQAYDSRRGYYSNQGFDGTGMHDSADNWYHRGYNMDHDDGNYQNTGAYNSGRGGYNTVTRKVGYSNDGQYHNSDRCRHLSGGTYHKDGCNNSNGGNAFNFKHDSTPPPPTQSGNSLNGHQHYWIHNKQNPKQFQ